MLFDNHAFSPPNAAKFNLSVSKLLNRFGGYHSPETSNLSIERLMRGREEIYKFSVNFYKFDFLDTNRVNCDRRGWRRRNEAVMLAPV